MSAQALTAQDTHPAGCRCIECQAETVTAAAVDAAARHVADRMARPAPPSLLLKVPDAAQQLGIGESKLREMEKAGLIEFLRIDGVTLVDYDSLVDFRDRLRAQKRIRTS